MKVEKYERKISAKVESRIAELAERLYNFIPDVCWMTEIHLATALNTNTWQIRNAKAYLLKAGLIQIEFRTNGKRKNPVHTLIKSSPTNQYSSEELADEINSNVHWSLLNEVSVRDFNYLPLEDKLEFYREMRLPFFPLHYPKFDQNDQPFCSCSRGRNCDSIGKHPAIAYKELDFTNDFTFRQMKSFWMEDFYIDNIHCNNSYNVGFKTDNFLVVDVDFRNGGAYSLEAIEEIYGELPRNLTVKTGNGRHIYARGNKRIKTGVDVLGFQGIDIRSRGSFIVAPFSDHHSGKQYEWLSMSPPENLPQDLVAELVANDKQLSYSEKNGNKLNADSALPSRSDTDFVISNGSRNTMMFRLASRERGKGAGQTEIFRYLQRVNADYCDEPLTERELVAISKSVMRFKPNREKIAFSGQNMANV